MKNKIKKSPIFRKGIKRYLFILYKKYDENLKGINKLFININRKLDLVKIEAKI